METPTERISMQATAALDWNDWTDPIALRERLATIHEKDFISLRESSLERAIVRQLKALTGLAAGDIREAAREDAYMLAMDAE